ncbi:hypothetical protein M9Y10_028866 [Tritrichomonas musculus]|uniref:BEACH domain-containing protein n=1 Tax=Tritrichomonas musculus TaxID=1915356 RepID=A0ABR2KLE4_9EUKA
MDASVTKLAQYIKESDLEVDENELERMSRSFDFIFPSYTDLVNQKEEFNKIIARDKALTDLPSIKFNINFSKPVLEAIAENYSSKTEENSKLKPVYINIIVIYYLFWKQNPTLDDLILILNLLILLIPSEIKCIFNKDNNEKSNNGKEKGKKDSKIIYNMNNIEYYCTYLYEPILHSIEFCFKFYFSSKKKEMFQDIFNIFSNFFYSKPLNAFCIQYLIPEFLQVLIQMFEIPKDMSHIPNELISYVDFLNDIYEKNVVVISPDTSKSIIFVINPYIPVLNISILKLFMNYSTEITDNMHSSIISQLTGPFFQLIESKSPYVFSKFYQTGEKINDIFSLLNEQPRIVFPFLFTDSKLEAKFKFVNSEKTFKDGLNVCHLLDLSDKPEIKTIIRDDIYEILEIMIKSLLNREPSQIAFFSSIALKLQEESPYFFDYCSIFIIFFKDMKNQHIFPLFWNTIFDTILFDDRVNCFHLNKDFLLFDKLRSLVFDILITMPNQQPSNLSDVLQSFSTRPSMIDEVIQRISSQLTLIPLESLADTKFIQIISSLMLYFQSLNLKCDDKSLLDIIEYTRSSLFYLILKIFDRIKNTYESLLWMSNMFFLPTFISFIFEKPARPLILNIIKNYIVTTNVNFYSGVLEKLEELCSLMASRVPQEAETDLACDLLQIIIEFQIQRKREKIYYFTYLSQTLINSLDFLTSSSKESNRYLSCVILFLASFLENLLTDQQTDKLSDTILRVSDGKPSISFLPFLVHLLAGKQISLTNPSFMIKQPCVLNLILKCYIDSDQFEEIFSFVKNLLKYSVFNVKISNSVKFDCLLIKQINRLKEEEANEKRIVLLLEIIEYICSISCSKETPMTLISLLYPIKNKFLSPFELLFARKITDIIMFSSSLPEEWIPLGLLDNKDSCFIKIKGFNKSNIPQTFLIVAMIYLDQKSSQNRLHDRIFEIKDSSENGIAAFICSGNLYVKHFNSSLISTAKIDDQISVGAWVPISFFIELPETESMNENTLSTKTSSSSPDLYNNSLTSDYHNNHSSMSSQKMFFPESRSTCSFYSEESNCYVTPYIGSSKTRRISYKWEKIEGNLTITIGNSTPKKEEETPAAFLSSVSFYDINEISDSSFFIKMNSPASRSIIREKRRKDNDQQIENANVPFLTVSMKKGENNKVSYNLSSAVNVVDEFHGTQIDCHMTFCSALREDDIVTFLLPLFTFIDYPTLNNKVLKELPEYLFGLLSATLEAIQEKQQVFKDKQGMLILSYLLNNSNAYVPSYSTYMQIYSILTSLIQPLQEDVISLFLLNHKNMINSNSQNQLRLAKHWNRVLAEDYPNQIKSITPILVLIFEQFISDEPIVKQIRANLNKVVLKIAMIKLAKNDLLSLVSLPLSSPVEHWDKIALEVMAILSKLIKKEGSAIYSLPSENLRYLTLTNLYLQTATVETANQMVKKLLKLILLIQKKNLFKSSFLPLDAHVEMVMREMPPLYAQSSVLLTVAHLCVERNEQTVLPLLFYLASNSDDSALFELFNYLSKASFGSLTMKESSSILTGSDNLILSDNFLNDKDNSNSPQRFPSLTLRARFWLISAAIDAPRDVQDMIVRYLLNCQNRDDLDNMTVIEIVSKVNREKSSTLLRAYMSIVAQSLIDQATEVSMTSSDEPSSLNENDSSERRISQDNLSINSYLSLNSVTSDSSSHLLLNQSAQRNLTAKIKNFLTIASHFLFFKREPLSTALFRTFEMSIFARLQKDEKTHENKRNRVKNIALNPSRYPHFSSLDNMNINMKNTFSDLQSFISSSNSTSSKSRTHKFSSFSRSESFHKLLLHADELYPNSDSSNSALLIDKLMPNPPKEFYKSIKKYANNLTLSFNNNNIIMVDNDDDDDFTCARAFGLKFDRNGNMVDHEVAFKCLTLSEFCNPIVQSFIPFDLMLSAFLVKKNRLAVEKHLSNIVLTQKQIKANKNTINLLSKYLNTRNKQEQVCSWIPNSYDELAASLAFEEMENRRSFPIEKREQKILHDFIEENKKIRKEIKTALSIRSPNLNQKMMNNMNENNSNQNKQKDQKPSEYVYFIESEVIELHSQEMITNMIAEKLWKSIEDTLNTTLFDSH